MLTIYPYRPSTHEIPTPFIPDWLRQRNIPDQNTVGHAFSASTGMPRPTLDYTTEHVADTITVLVKLPGHTKETIELKLDKEALCIKAVSENRFIGNQDGKIPVPECSYKEAKLENGILTISLTAKSTSVEIPIS